MVQVGQLKLMKVKFMHCNTIIDTSEKATGLSEWLSERNSCIMVVMPNWVTATLLPIIAQHVLPGTCIITDD